MINIQDLLEEAGVQSWEAERRGCWAHRAVGQERSFSFKAYPHCRLSSRLPRRPVAPRRTSHGNAYGLIESTYYLNGWEAGFLGRCLAAVLGIEGETQHRDCRDG